MWRKKELSVKEIAGGRDGKYGPTAEEGFAWGYKQIFTELHRMGIEPRKIFVGACGFGRDVVAAHRAWPNSSITAVSLLDTPAPEVVAEVANLLDFQERSILDYLNQADDDFSLRGHDLVILMNAISIEFRQTDFYHLLPKIVGPNGYVFHQVGGGEPLSYSLMSSNWKRLSLPVDGLFNESSLWQRDN